MSLDELPKNIEVECGKCGTDFITAEGPGDKRCPFCGHERAVELDA